MRTNLLHGFTCLHTTNFFMQVNTRTQKLIFAFKKWAASVYQTFGLFLRRSFGRRRTDAFWRHFSLNDIASHSHDLICVTFVDHVVTAHVTLLLLLLLTQFFERVSIRFCELVCDVLVTRAISVSGRFTSDAIW